MKRIRIVGLCLVAMFAFSAVAAGSAFAGETPVWAKCVKTIKNPTTHKYEGRYSNKECTEELAPGEGEYALEELPGGEKILATGKSKTVVITAEGKSGNWQTIVCGKDEMSSKLWNENEEAVFYQPHLTLEKCVGMSHGTEAPCGNAVVDEKPVIEDNSEAGDSVYWAEEAEKNALLQLKGGLKFECGGEEVKINQRGYADGALTNTSKGLQVSWMVSGPTHTQAISGFWFEEPITEDQTWQAEGTSTEATVVGIDELKPEEKGISIRNENELS